MSHTVLLGLVLLAGCQSPSLHVTCGLLVPTADFTGRAEYEATLDDGTATSVRDIVFAHEEGFLYGFDDEGAALALSVHSRVEATDFVDGCPVLAEDQGPPMLRSHMRVDWSTELTGDGAEELVEGPIEPIAFVVPADFDESRFPQTERDADDRIVRHAFSTLVWSADLDEAVWVRHELRF